MQKVIIILLVFSFTTGCSLTRKNIGSEYKDQTDDNNKFKIAYVKEQNITKGNFNISKAEIEIVSNNERKSLFASVKYCNPDKYLVSIKSKTGIEVARIYLTNDTVLINDRFNRIQYYGSTQVLYDRYGITSDLISLFFGDFNDFKCVNKDGYICKNSRLEIICADRYTEINYEIDCNRNKVLVAKLESQTGGNELKFSFTDFKMIKNILLAHEIEVTGLPGIYLMKINIRKIDFPGECAIEFIPGNRYEKIEIL